MSDKPLVVAILDGFGISNYETGNAPLLAKMENVKIIHQNYPWTLLETSGPACGLVEGAYGICQNNHMIMGSGRVISAYCKQIADSVADNSFFQNEILLDAINEAKKRGKTSIHIIGLVSHSPITGYDDDIFALIKLISQNGLTPIVHAITDGKDVNKKSAISYLSDLYNALKSCNGKLADISGRHYALDDSEHWLRTIKTWNLMTRHDGDNFSDFEAYVNKEYELNCPDEFFIPQYNIAYEDSKIDDDDIVILTVYRYAEQLLSLMLNQNQEQYDTYVHRNNLAVYSLAEFGGFNLKSVFKEKTVDFTLSEVISQHGLKQLKISDKLRINDITYYLNGRHDEPFKDETWHSFPIDKKLIYDLHPQLQAVEITNYILEHLHDYDVIFVNYSNPDVLGHTGNLDAAIKGLKVIDLCLGSLYDKLINHSEGKLIITADHGNCEKMVDENGNIKTYHTTCKVPFILCERKIHLADDNVSIANIAPTILQYLGLQIPKSMQGTSLIKQNTIINKMFDSIKRPTMILEVNTLNEKALSEIISINAKQTTTNDNKPTYVDENDFSLLE